MRRHSTLFFRNSTIKNTVKPKLNGHWPFNNLLFFAMPPAAAVLFYLSHQKDHSVPKNEFDFSQHPDKREGQSIEELFYIILEKYPRASEKIQLLMLGFMKININRIHDSRVFKAMESILPKEFFAGRWGDHPFCGNFYINEFDPWFSQHLLDLVKRGDIETGDELDKFLILYDEVTYHGGIPGGCEYTLYIEIAEYYLKALLDERFSSSIFFRQSYTEKEKVLVNKLTNLVTDRSAKEFARGLGHARELTQCSGKKILFREFAEKVPEFLLAVSDKCENLKTKSQITLE